jgi:hypothetical protein
MASVLVTLTVSFSYITNTRMRCCYVHSFRALLLPPLSDVREGYISGTVLIDTYFLL